MSAGVIYMLIFADGRKYIGQTIDLLARIRRHRTAANTGKNVHVSKAWAEMGVPAVEIICKAETHELDALEQQFIAQHNTLFPSGLNRNTGGKRGALACEETCELKSDANRRRYEDPAERERTRKSTLQRYSDPIERQKASATQKSRYESQSARDKTSAAMKRVGARPEEQQRKSIASRALWADPAYRGNLLAAKLISAPKGENCPWAKVTSAIVKAIRIERAQGMSLSNLAHKYGISEASVSGIANRKTWKHVD